jgi:hypothetical protein
MSGGGYESSLNTLEGPDRALFDMYAPNHLEESLDAAVGCVSPARPTNRRESVLGKHAVGH